MCMSEPGAGTDVLGMRTTATKSTGAGGAAFYTLNGAKMWITNGTLDGRGTGDVYLVYARTGGWVGLLGGALVVCRGWMLSPEVCRGVNHQRGGTTTMSIDRPAFRTRNRPPATDHAPVLMIARTAQHKQNGHRQEPQGPVHVPGGEGHARLQAGAKDRG